MKPNPPASMADGDDSAVRTTGDVLAGLDAQDQAPSGCHNRADVNVLGLLGCNQFKEAPASFFPHHAALLAAASTASA